MILDIKRLPEITIGHETDNLTNTIEIDVRPWKRKNPGLDSWDIVVHSPNGDTYLAPEVVEHNGILSWIITDSDTAYPGKGTYEVVAKGANGESISSGPVKMRVADRTKGTASETPPEAAQAWVDKVLDAAQRAEDAAERAESGKPDDEYIAKVAKEMVTWANIPDKPFGQIGHEGIVLDGVQLVLDSESGEGIISADFRIYEKVDYMVVWNGAYYQCKGVIHVMDGMNVVWLGNLAALGAEGGNNDAPFLIGRVPADVAAELGFTGVVMGFNGTTQLQLSIASLDTFAQVDENLIPASIARVDEVSGMIEEKLGAIENGAY